MTQFGIIFALTVASRLSEGLPIVAIDMSTGINEALGSRFPGAVQILRRAWQYLQALEKQIAAVTTSA